ncbi:inosine triphosphate pyrophosphatase [Aspergillus pseudonomiae]|uniref:Inosine triphosphate pyrophosphatase n=1 Tax=Aspergillus pseudonomiae TaxID=1506151 RepID=A0A5N7CSA5_9EURO|nr:inosine triphosphate pyrophosphatase [Aspergillus pseudonomiae]KAB8258557.1 inosine triphosphate pyrophosphatase [Aspergillus pseudonomiae]KAE8397120.1 inosine triphosphate pyrophosphatase [Aspergillus pseudonomiae]
MTDSNTPLIFVTGNKNKVLEVKAILGPTATLEVLDINLPEIQGSVEEITREKCRAAAETIGGPVLVEDSALEMHALGGLPGAYVKAFVETIGNEGLNRILSAFDDKTAEAVCTFGYSPGPGHEPLLFQGRLQGRIVPARGVSSFGWEPIFEVEGEGVTLAEMEVGKKNGLSHRFKALVKFREWFLGARGPV